MAEHAPLLHRPEPAPRDAREARKAGVGAVATADSPATAQLAAQGELVQRCPAVQEAARMGERLAARPGPSLPPAQRVPDEPDVTGLGHELKSGLEALSGRDLSPVRVELNSPKPAQLNAKAYTQWPKIFVAPGEEEHLPHEGWHAAQQLAGDVKPTIDVAGTPVNDDPRLEREADVMGARALTVQRKAAGRAARSGSVTAPVAQRVIRLADDADPRLAEALEAINNELVFVEVALSRQVVLITNSANRQSESWRKTPRNKNDFESRARAYTDNPGAVDFLVTINNGELSGLPIDPLRSFDPRTFEVPSSTSSRTSSISLGRLMTETSEILALASRTPSIGGVPVKFPRRSGSSSGLFSQMGRLSLLSEPELSLPDLDTPSFRPTSLVSLLSSPTVPRFEDIPPAKTSLGIGTVLLHELGHVRRELSVSSEPFLTKVDERLQPPDASFLVDPSITEAVSKGKLDSSIWQFIRNKLNAVNTWVHQAKGNLVDAPKSLHPAPPSQDAATEIEQLIARAQIEVGLWLEYDVISNVEHPYAASKNEPIRTYHGEEAPLAGSEDDLPPLVDIDLNALLRPTLAPRNLGEVRERMVSEAQRLAGNLPLTLAAIVDRYNIYRPAALASLDAMLNG